MILKEKDQNLIVYLPLRNEVLRLLLLDKTSL